MEVIVNNKNLSVPEKVNIAFLLDSLGYPSGGIAVAVGQDIIPKVKWEETALKQNDQVTIITATQGG